MNAQDKGDEGDRVAQSTPRRPYAAPVLVTLGSFSDLTLKIGPNGKDDGGSQRGRRSTRF